MTEIHCDRPGCCGIVDTRSPGHKTRRIGTKRFYFCDSECEDAYDNPKLVTSEATGSGDFLHLLFGKTLPSHAAHASAKH